MPERDHFPHLPLPLVRTGVPRTPPRHSQEVPAQTDQNRKHPADHARRLNEELAAVADRWRVRMGQRPSEAPVLPEGIPMLLQVESELDIEWLATTFGFEIVSQDVDGYVIVASAPVRLADLEAKIEGFAGGARGSGNTARLYRISDQDRMQRILSPELLRRWPSLDDEAIYCVDIGVECRGLRTISRPPVRRMKESDEHFQERVKRYQAKNPPDKVAAYLKKSRQKTEQSEEAFHRSHAGWEARRAAAQEAWEQVKDEREEAVEQFVLGYRGEILRLREASARALVHLPDSLEARIRISGRGLRDLVLNFPFLFDVSLPEESEEREAAGREHPGRAPRLVLTPPPDGAPCVCVIDSGLQEEHLLLEPAIDKAASHSFLPEEPGQVADYVRPAGHGTRVAGAVLYREHIPSEGRHELPFWVQNARVLDGQCQLPRSLYPPRYIADVVARFSGSPRLTRLYNHSINGRFPCRLERMSAWPAMMDLLSYEHDVLFIQSAGNLERQGASPGLPGIDEHLAAGRGYPDYLGMGSCRISSPAQSLQALTVGSVSYGQQDGALGLGGFTEPSSFSKTGLGLWNSIKPDVVEFGGDLLLDGADPPRVVIRPAACPDLVRATLHEPGPAHDRDAVGTSFAAPKVAHLAAHLQALLPDEPTLLYRALIAQSARWPAWTSGRDSLMVLRHLGFGLPDLDRATYNSLYRVTLITHGVRRIGARVAHIYQVPVPAQLRNPGKDCRIRLDVTLSYAARPRRTRRPLRSYLSTWLTWMVSYRGESLESFEGRALSDAEPVAGTDREVIDWCLREQGNWGDVPGTHRGNATLQKDWAYLSSYHLPESLCLAVVGHRGWSHDPADAAKYALVVTFEAVNRDMEVYAPIRAAVERLPQMETQLEVVGSEVEVEVR